MPVKSVKKEGWEPEITYPVLMHSVTHPNLVVLFYDRTKGTVVHASSPARVGRYATDWLPEKFVEFHGTISLSNKKETV